MHLLGCLFGLLIVVVVIILLAPMILMQIVRSFFGTSGRQKSRPFGQGGFSQQKENTQQQSSDNNQSENVRRSKPNSRQRRSKIFEKGEGEYVDFTEVKE